MAVQGRRCLEKEAQQRNKGFELRTRHNSGSQSKWAGLVTSEKGGGVILKESRGQKTVDEVVWLRNDQSEY